MRHDPIGGLFYSNVEDRFAEYVLVGQDEAGDVVALAFSIPFQLDGSELPLNGWDGVIRNGVLTAFAGEQPDAISAIEIAIRPDHQNRGLSAQMLVAMRDNAARHGFPELVAPVRPSHKPDVHTPMEDYAFQVRDDGLPVDPWLRVHVRAGGVIDKVAPRSMVIPGTLEEWREWTGLPFDRTGLVELPRALAPGLLIGDDADAELVIGVWHVDANVVIRCTATGSRLDRRVGTVQQTTSAGRRSTGPDHSTLDRRRRDATQGALCVRPRPGRCAREHGSGSGECVTDGRRCWSGAGAVATDMAGLCSRNAGFCPGTLDLKGVMPKARV